MFKCLLDNVNIPLFSIFCLGYNCDGENITVYCTLYICILERDWRENSSSYELWFVEPFKNSQLTLLALLNL